MRIRTALLALPLAAALSALPGLSTPAAAASADSTCPSPGNLCLWEDQNYAGARFTVRALDPAVGTCVSLAGHGWGAGRAESGENNGSKTATLYTSTTCSGTAYQIPPGATIPTIGFASNSVYVY